MIDRKAFSQAIAEMSAEKRDEVCLRRCFCECYWDIHALISECGATRNQIYDRLKRKFGESFSISKATFYRCLDYARKKHEASGASKDMRHAACHSLAVSPAPDDDKERVKTSEELKARYEKFNSDLEKRYDEYLKELEIKG